MKNDAEFEGLREAAWRGKLTALEEGKLRSWLAAHPQTKDDWQSEAALNEALRKLPQPRVSSNFTARVMDAARMESETGRARVRGGWGTWFNGARWLPKVAFASMVFGAGLFAYHEIHEARLGEIRQSLTQVPSLANPEILQDFEAIQVMSQAPKADEDLIRLMQ